MAGSERDKIIGANLAAMRGDVTQDELARRMREHGFKWSQSTVWAVERGDRPMKLAEAEAVLDCLYMNDVIGVFHLLGKPINSTVYASCDEIDRAVDLILDEWMKLEEKRLELAKRIYINVTREGEVDRHAWEYAMVTLSASSREYMLKRHVCNQYNDQHKGDDEKPDIDKLEFSEVQTTLHMEPYSLEIPLDDYEKLADLGDHYPLS